MTKWEYYEHSERIATDKNLLKKLNVLGSEGWELVAVTYEVGFLRAILKRPKP